MAIVKRAVVCASVGPNVQGDRRCAASSRSVQRAKRTGSTAALDLYWRLLSLELNLEAAIDCEVLKNTDSRVTLSRQAQIR